MTDSFGARLKACRRAVGLTQTEFGEKVGLTRSSIANVEAGRQGTLLHDVERFARALDVDPAWLAFGRVTVEGRPLPKPRTVASSDLVKLSNDLQALAVRAMKLSSDPDEVEEVPLAALRGDQPEAGS